MLTCLHVISCRFCNDAALLTISIVFLQCAIYCEFVRCDEVCGSDGITYSGECRLRAENCETGADVQVKYRGACCKHSTFIIY